MRNTNLIKLNYLHQLTCGLLYKFYIKYFNKIFRGPILMLKQFFFNQEL